MLGHAHARHLGPTAALVSAALFYGCTDAPNPVAPRGGATPHALAAAVNVTNTDDADSGSLRQTILDSEDEALLPVTLTVNRNVAFSAETGIATVTGTISCDGPAPTPIRVVLSQTQKRKGKLTTIVEGTFAIPFTCVSTPASWSVPLTAATGSFETGAATGTISTLSVPIGYLPATVTASLKLFKAR